MNRPLVYLSVPYSHDDPNVIADRVKKVNAAAAYLMRKGFTIFSPISQNHPIAVECGLPTDWEYWEKFDHDFISCCNKLIVLKLPGWNESVGVASEIRIATEMGLDIEYIDSVVSSSDG